MENTLSSYKYRLRHLANVKSIIDQQEPVSQKFTHLRPRYANQEVFAKKERQRDNQMLVYNLIKLSS